jgi:predicted LPLAT superfamily acyltransferase
MSKWQGKSQTNVTGYKIFAFFIRHLGIRAAYTLLIFVALYYFLFSWKSSRPILSFYRQRLGFSALKTYWYLYKNYFCFGQTLIDKFVIMSGQLEAFTFNFDGSHHLRQIIAEGKGGILLSAHAGNWEAAGQLFSHLNTPLNIVMYDGEEANIKQYLEGAVNRYFRVIFVKNDLSHIFKINEALLANEIVCMHADRFLPGNKTITTDFFGALAAFPEGPFIMALKFRVPVAYVHAFKDTATHYHFYSTPLKRFNPKDYCVQDLAADYVENLEARVRRYPEQWFNYYDFWQTS